MPDQNLQITLNQSMQSLDLIIEQQQQNIDLIVDAITAVPGPGAVAKGEVFTLTQTEISRKYISLSEIIIDNQSVMVFIEGAGILAEVGVDYSVSGQDIFWTSYALEGILSVGDKLRIIYN